MYSRPQIVQTSVRHFSKRKPSSKTNMWAMMAPHASVAALMFATSNAHLSIIPATTAMFHYLYKMNHIKKATLYWDMQKLGKNENYIATFEKIREILLTDERFDILIEQREFDEGGADPHRSTTLIFLNPTFMPFAYKV